ncbi:phytoene desaturase family protein [Arcticibacterium luteifluviistationis]|nr:oleate hydratase [Arcticibacterium luteifluviistationis]
MKKISIIGSGFSSIAAACYLAQAGHEVHVYEKNKTIGGRARRLEKDGFTFDIGPTFYWMPDVFEKFFNDFNHIPSDFYELEKLNPGYEVYFDKNDSIKISDNIEEIYQLFEETEKGSAAKLKSFLKDAKRNYEIAVQDLVYRPGNSPLELITLESATRLRFLFVSIQKQIQKKFKSPRLRKLLEFPVLFLGAKPSNTPAMYNFMNYADFGLGTWHPKGGMYSVVEGMQKLAESLGVKFITEANVEKISVENGQVESLTVNGEKIVTDFVLSGADYHHTETLLDEKYRQYSEKYWSKKVFAPSALLFYIGINHKLENLSHHTLFFDTDFEPHAADIYDTPRWPETPLFYASFPSMTDTNFAPEGKEAATILMPIAPDLEDTEELRQKYLKLILERLESLTGQDIQNNMLFCESYCVNDFKEDYNSYKGNAYGLANILTQTAFLRPKIKSKKVKNLIFSGQLTVPGPGVPPALISGKIAAEQIFQNI